MSHRTFYPPSESDIPLHGWRPYSDMHRERIRAHAKHDERGGSMERLPFDDPAWLPVLVEEIGEVARVLCDDKLGVLGGDLRTTLRKELVQVGAMTAAWIDAIDAVMATHDAYGTPITPPVNLCDDETAKPRAQGGIMTQPSGPIVINSQPNPTPAGLAQAVAAEIADAHRRGNFRVTGGY